MIWMRGPYSGAKPALPVAFAMLKRQQQCKKTLTSGKLFRCAQLHDIAMIAGHFTPLNKETP